MIIDFNAALVRSRTACVRHSTAIQALTVSLGTDGYRLTIRLGAREEMDIGNYNPAKAAHVIAYLALKTASRSIEIVKAMKLVYLSDRENIALWGEPILDEPRVAMKFGPVNKRTYEFAKGEHGTSSGWSTVLEAIDPTDKTKALRVREGVTVDDLDELSDADIASLDAVWDRVGYMHPFVLAKWTHEAGNVPEWQDPNGSSVPIPLERIMAEVGIKDPAATAARLEGRRTITDLLRRPS